LAFAADVINSTPPGGQFLMRPYPLLTLALLATAARAGNPPELKPRRPECATLLPQRDEEHDMARLVRADEFLNCERDGYPKHLAPPWKDSDEATNKLSDACAYFGEKAAREYPNAGTASLKLATNRCLINVLQAIIMKLVDPGKPTK
jgi:hypothetical protein